jgi:zinc/manganese transport system substrate-binding protein
MNLEVQIKEKFGGTSVASTESIFVYMANATGLDLVSPPGFMDAVAEGNDPSFQDVIAMDNLLEGGNSSVHVLVYNNQTVTPLTSSVEALAVQYHVPIVAITETIEPKGAAFQVWMESELDSLYAVLNATAEVE